MDPTNVEHQSSFELPTPQAPRPEAGGAQVPTPERGGAGAEVGKQAPSGSPSHPAITPTLSPLQPATRTRPGTPHSSQPPTHDPNPAIADDVDVIEKEWVEKAKAIVAQTKADPHKQNKEMSKFKADYVKKRYNKDIRVSEE
jgi:hypothetical protein